MPDRYADAVRARRAELTAQRELLSGSPRAELRGALAVARLAAGGIAGHELAGLERELLAHAARAGRAARRALPEHAATAVAAVAGRVARAWVARALPAARRVAAARWLYACAPGAEGWPVPDPVGCALPAPEPPAGPGRALLESPAWWRLLPVPLLLPAGWAVPPTVALAAVAVAVAGLVVAAQVAAERARLRRWVAAVCTAARAGIAAELARWALDLEAAVGADLDAAVARHQARVERELRALAPDGRPADVAG